VNNIDKFIELVEDQFQYGGTKYAGSSDKREATDDLFEDFGYSWLLGTLAKYCKRYSNLSRERDLLKIACYCYILWLKRGYFVTDMGVDSPPLDTNVTVKSKYFGDFISIVKTKETPRKVLEAIKGYDTLSTTIELIYGKLKEYNNKPWKELTQFDIKLIFHFAYEEWNEHCSSTEEHDTDTFNKK